MSFLRGVINAENDMPVSSSSSYPNKHFFDSGDEDEEKDRYSSMNLSSSSSSSSAGKGGPAANGYAEYLEEMSEPDFYNINNESEVVKKWTAGGRRDDGSIIRPPAAEQTVLNRDSKSSSRAAARPRGANTDPELNQVLSVGKVHFPQNEHLKRLDQIEKFLEANPQFKGVDEMKYLLAPRPDSYNDIKPMRNEVAVRQITNAPGWHMSFINSSTTQDIVFTAGNGLLRHAEYSVAGIVQNDVSQQEGDHMGTTGFSGTYTIMNTGEKIVESGSRVIIDLNPYMVRSGSHWVPGIVNYGNNPNRKFLFATKSFHEGDIMNAIRQRQMDIDDIGAKWAKKLKGTFPTHEQFKQYRETVMDLSMGNHMLSRRGTELGPLLYAFTDVPGFQSPQIVLGIIIAYHTQRRDKERLYNASLGRHAVSPNKWLDGFKDPSSGSIVTPYEHFFSSSSSSSSTVNTRAENLWELHKEENRIREEVPEEMRAYTQKMMVGTAHKTAPSGQPFEVFAHR